MITLRCTKRFLNYMGIVPDTINQPTTALLGDWYVNLIPVYFGDLILFLNEKSLLTTVIPIYESSNLFALFRNRLANLLAMIGIPREVIVEEINHYTQIKFGKTKSRSILGSMNDFAWHYQILIDETQNNFAINLSEFEYRLSQMPCKLLNYQFPEDVARMLLSMKLKHHTNNS